MTINSLRKGRTWLIGAVTGLLIGISPWMGAQEQTWSYTYNDLGLMTSADGPRTDVEDITTYTYDEQGNLTSVTQPLGYLTTYDSHDGAGRALSVTDPSGLTTEFEYHPRGWLTQTTVKDRDGDTSNDRITSYSYYSNGELESLTLPNGASLTFEYNGAKHLTAISNDLGERIEYELDLAGNRTREVIISATGSITYSVDRAYDELSRLMGVMGNNGQHTQIDYDANDNPVQTTNALGHSSAQQYDALNRVKSSLDPLAAETQYQYDAQGNLTHVTDANGNTTVYSYDGLGNLLSLDSPDTGLTTYTHDSAGNRTSQTDARGVVTEYEYDALNRLVKVTYPANPSENVTYTYCTPSQYSRCLPHQIINISRADGYGAAYAYTAFHEPRFVFEIFDGQSSGIWFYYDESGNRIREQTFSGRETFYDWDSQGRITKISTQLNSGPAQTIVDNVTYLPFGSASSYIYGNDLTHALDYSLDYQIERIQVGGINPVLDYAYQYNPVDNIVGIDNTLDPSRNQSFVFDAASRLINAQGIYGEIEYEYDPVGNRLIRIYSENGQNLSEYYGYHSGTNQLSYMIRAIADGGGYDLIQTYAYDGAGNISQLQEARPATVGWDWQMADEPEYNQANRRAKMVREGQTVAEFHYNPLGQRILKKIGGQVAERYSYSTAGQLVEVRNGANQPIRQYFYLNGKPVGMVNAAESATALYYVHPDHLGTPHKLTNQNQQVVWSADYTPFGEATVTGEQEVYSRFPGQYYDEESGLYYNYFRDYNPALGRYVQSDPIGLGGGINTYAYGMSNPVINFDPFGLRCWTNSIGQKVCDSGNPYGNRPYCPSGDCAVYPAQKNAATSPLPCKTQCTSGAFWGWTLGLGVGAAYTFAGGPVGFGYAAGSLGTFGTTVGLAACLEACKQDNMECEFGQ